MVLYKFVIFLVLPGVIFVILRWIPFLVQVPPALTSPQMRRTFSAYPGTGAVYAMISTYRNVSSAYVPSFSYACSPLSNPESCSLLSKWYPRPASNFRYHIICYNDPFCLFLDTAMSKVICAAIFFVGLFLTFIGHVWFCAEMFFLGTISGGVVGHILLAAVQFEDISSKK